MELVQKTQVSDLNFRMLKNNTQRRKGAEVLSTINDKLLRSKVEWVNKVWEIQGNRIKI